MGFVGALLCILAGLCGVMGIITATGVIDPLEMEGVLSGIEWLFWFGLAGILFIASIALSVGRSE